MPKPDRRIQRTRQLLHEALIALILEKGYDAITVQDILERANLGRSTFYAHYHDKEDLLLSGFQSLFEAFQQQYLQAGPATDDPVQAARDLSLFFFRHAAEHRPLFRAMIGQQGSKRIVEHTQSYLTQLIRSSLESWVALHPPVPGPIAPLDLLAYYTAASFLSLLTWWLDHDLPYTPEQMDTLYQRLVFPGIREVLLQ